MPEETTFNLQQFVSDQFAAGSAEEAGAPVSAPAAESGEPAGSPEGVGQDAAQGAPGQPPASDFPHWEQVIAGDPALAAKAKTLEGDYTRKAQELAEQRQQVAGFMALQRLAEENPAEAARVVQEWVSGLTGGAPEQAPDPLSGMEYLTDGERMLAQELQQVKQQNAQFAQFLQQQERNQQQQRVMAEYQQLTQSLGRELNDQEQVALGNHYRQGGFKTLTAAYRDLHWDAEMNRALQKGRDEASTVIEQKAAMGKAPSALVSRQSANPEPPGAPHSRERLEWIVRQAIAAES